MSTPSAFNPMSGNPLLDRDDVARAMADLHAPLKAAMGPDGASLKVDGSGAFFQDRIVGLEAFARPLWGLAALSAGGGAVDWTPLRRGLVNGVDPDHPAYWGAETASAQRRVELAAIGFALALATDQFWTPLSPEQQARVGDYLLAARQAVYQDNNWKFFRVMLDLGLAAVGLGDDPGTEACLTALEAMHLEGGWYRDGPKPQVDWYVAFAFQFYSLIYIALAKGDAERKARFEQRARAIAVDLAWWFADDGAALPFGRSLTYRFACAGFWGGLAFAGIEALPWGVIKGYYLRHLRWWSQQPITRRDGLLSLGYAYPNSELTEVYSSQASPYWAFKAFLPLALPAEHPFWSAEETPAETEPAVRSLPAPGMVIARSPGQVIALCGGQANNAIRFGAEKYNKFAYSSRYGFSIEGDLRRFDRAIVDNMLAFSEDGYDYRGRHGDEEALIAGDLIWARWRPWRDVEVETWLYPDGPLHVRLHRITTSRPLQTREGGFAIARTDPGKARVWVRSGSAVVQTASDISGIIALDPASRRMGRLLQALPNTNLMAPRTFVPLLVDEIPVGTSTFSAAVYAVPSALGPRPARPARPDIAALERRIRVEGRPIGAMGHPRPKA